MSRIFLSHSSVNNAEAIAIRDWMKAQGWEDVFLDLDPERGLVAGDRWQAILKTAVDRCELVIVLVSPDWAASSWCKAEFLLTKHGSSPKAILPVIVAPTPFSALPSEMTAEYQQVDLTRGTRSATFAVPLPPGDKTATVAFSEEGLRHLKIGIMRAGLHATYFDWPPANDPHRPPYRGLKPLEADDAGIFFGREAPIIEALDRLRVLREAAPPRLLVILGASGAGKSSFLRAGLLPRLKRDDRHFLPLPIIRPERAVVSGETGLLSALEGACRAGGLAKPRAELRAAIDGGAAALRPLLQALADRATPPVPDQGGKEERAKPKAPMLVLSIDQGEELFLAEGQKEAEPFLAVLRDFLTGDAPAVTVLVTIRSDNCERLQDAKGLEGIRREYLGLSPMPKGSYTEAIKGPSRRLDGTPRALKIEESLVAELLADIEDGINKDALPLLAFILERLYVEYGAGGNLRLSQYRQIGGIQGSIEAAVEEAFKAADADPTIPKDRTARLALLRHGLIPWIAGIDPDSGAPRRRVARMSEIPPEAVPLIQRLVEQRLLSTDVTRDGVSIIEPAHEALLRQWGLLRQWLKEDTGLLIVMDGVKRAARDWAKNQKGAAWLTHAGARLKAAEQLTERHDLAANLESADRAYLVACRKAAARSRTRRMQAMVGGLTVAVVAVVAWVEHDDLKALWREVTITGPYIAENFTPYVLKPEDERALKPGDTFRECASDCPEMVVIPAGEFWMGSRDGEGHESGSEYPRHKVKIDKPFAVGKFEVTWNDWDACVAKWRCDGGPTSDNGYGTGRQPLINVSWDQAKVYVNWLSQMTGKQYQYRLLSEAEWEYAARGVTSGDAPHPSYPWGDKASHENANYGRDQCCQGKTEGRDKWYYTAPVGQFPANPFGLYDMHGNVYEWVEDPWHGNYSGSPPTNGSAWTEGGDEKLRVVRGGSWYHSPDYLRSAIRYRLTTYDRNNYLGFRVARTLTP